MKLRLLFITYLMAAILCFVFMYEAAVYYQNKPVIALGCSCGIMVFAMYFMFHCADSLLELLK